MLSPEETHQLFARCRADDNEDAGEAEEFYTPEQLRSAEAFCTYFHLAAIAKAAGLYVDREALERQAARRHGLSTAEVRAAVEAFTAAVPLDKWVEVAAANPLIVAMGEGVGIRERTLVEQFAGRQGNAAVLTPRAPGRVFKFSESGGS
jgi:hypothetical protein